MSVVLCELVFGKDWTIYQCLFPTKFILIKRLCTEKACSVLWNWNERLFYGKSFLCFSVFENLKINIYGQFIKYNSSFLIFLGVIVCLFERSMFQYIIFEYFLIMKRFYVRNLLTHPVITAKFLWFFYFTIDEETF